jgi:hypothetical protein
MQQVRALFSSPPKENHEDPVSRIFRHHFSRQPVSAHAGTPIINLSVGGEISPDVYGQVQFGNAPPPQVFNDQPMMVIRQPPGMVVEPMYLHVPPGHQKHWSRYCHRYNACNRPVYFVKTGRYQPDMRGHGGRGD